MQAVESGLIVYWRRKYWPRKQCDKQATSVGAKAILLDDINGNFCLLGLGIMCSLGAFVAEVLLITYRRSTFYRRSK